MVVLLTEKVLQSFWVLLEMRIALRVGVEIILVPLDGHRWEDEENRATLGFPAASKVFAAFEAFFPDLAEEEVQSIHHLFDAGLNADHVLPHYTAYLPMAMRALSRRCGVPLKARKRLMSLGVEDADPQETAELIVQVYEQNALKTSKWTASDTGKRLHVVEASKAGNTVTTYSPSEFGQVVLTQRVDDMLPAEDGKELTPSMAAAVPRAVSAVQDADLVRQIAEKENDLGDAFAMLYDTLEDDAGFLAALAESDASTDQLLEEVAEEVDDSVFEVAAELGTEGGATLKSQLKSYIAFYQINASFLVSFPSVKWPANVLSFFDFGIFKILNIDIDIAAINYSVAGAFNFANFTVICMTAFLCMIIGMATGYFLVCVVFLRKKEMKPRRNMFLDKLFMAFTTIAFVWYPPICARLLSMYQVRRFGDWDVTERDWSKRVSDVTVWHNIGVVFILLYVVGMPLFFLHSAYRAVKPKPEGLSALKTMEWSEMRERLATRFHMLFDAYDDVAWFWEEVEMVRKMVMISLVTFIMSGSITQLFFSTLIAFIFLLLVIKWAPFLDPRLDWLELASQTACVFTLVLILALSGGMLDDDRIPASVFDSLLLLAQLTPPIVGTLILLMSLVAKALQMQVKKRRRAKAAKIVIDETPKASVNASIKGVRGRIEFKRLNSGSTSSFDDVKRTPAQGRIEFKRLNSGSTSSFDDVKRTPAQGDIEQASRWKWVFDVNEYAHVSLPALNNPR